MSLLITIAVIIGCIISLVFLWACLVVSFEMMKETWKRKYGMGRTIRRGAIKDLEKWIEDPKEAFRKKNLEAHLEESLKEEKEIKKEGFGCSIFILIISLLGIVYILTILFNS